MKTSHIGSLPFTDIQTAIDYTFGFDLPVLFSLPKRDATEFMDKQAEILIQAGHYRPPYQNEFFEQMKMRGVNEFKYQFLGPYTLFRILDRKWSLAHICKHLLALYSANLATWTDYHCLWMLDEPFLFEALDEEYEIVVAFINNLINISREHEFMALHCCGPLEVGRINRFGKHCLFHLDLSQFSSQNLSEISVSYLPGVSMRQEMSNIKEILRNTFPKFILPSCGLALNSDLEAFDIRNRLELLKN